MAFQILRLLKEFKDVETQHIGHCAQHNINSNKQLLQAYYLWKKIIFIKHQQKWTTKYNKRK
uniref:Uncharacterized protein n=1 Tax=Arundo donax TaxID=35708 RepID=A0A0A9AHZ6_ARUDO